MFERLHFLGADDPDGLDGPTPSTDLVHIQGGLKCVFNDVVLIGGNTALHLQESSHMTLRNVLVRGDHHANNGIRLVGGGSHSIYHTRIDAPDGGSSLSIEGGEIGIGQIQIDGLFGEGKRMRHFLRLAGSETAPVREIIMKDIDVPTPWGPGKGVTYPSYGLHINDWVHSIRILNSHFSPWATNLTMNGGRLVLVRGGAENIQIEQMAAWEQIEQNGLSDYIQVDAGARRVHIEMFDFQRRRILREEGMIEDWSVLGSVAYVGAAGTVRASVAGVIDTIRQGRWGALVDTDSQEGQQVILLGAGSPTVLVSGAGNLQLTTPTYTLASNCLMHLVYAGSRWREVSRACH